MDLSPTPQYPTSVLNRDWQAAVEATGLSCIGPTNDQISPQRQREIVDAVRRGTVPQQSLDALVTGFDRFEQALPEALERVKAGSGLFRAIRGEYGCGKTFFARWFAETAKRSGFATAEVQVSETEYTLSTLRISDSPIA